VLAAIVMKKSAANPFDEAPVHRHARLASSHAKHRAIIKPRQFN